MAMTLAGCSGGSSTPDGSTAAPPTETSEPSTAPTTSASATPSSTGPTLMLEDIHVSGRAQANREGLLLCGDRLVAAPPVAGIENNAFAVFDQDSGEGELTHVEVPEESGLEENARWLLRIECVDSPDVVPNGPVLSFAYQEMPLPEEGGVGVRGAYSLDGQLLWMRTDLNQPAALVEGLLVLGADPAQPERIVDAVSGEELRSFGAAPGTRIVLTHDRIMVRGRRGGPFLTDVTGEIIARMRTSGRFSADGNVIFGVNFRDVAAYQAHDGRPIWTFPTRLDPLGTPRVDESVGVAVIVDDAYVARGLDAGTGKELWALPTRVENPRVTMASGLVLLDQPDAGYQVLLDSRTGVRLPEPPTRIIDLKPAGALVIQDGVPGVISPHDLRTPPPTSDTTTVPG
jgi:hypothetical protein